MFHAKVLLAGLLVLTLHSGVFAASGDIDTGSPTGTYFSSYGVPDTATYGQTFVAPSGLARVRDFSYFIQTGGPSITQRSYIAEWNPATRRITNILFQSGNQTVAGSTSFERVRTSVYGVKLQPGRSYVIFSSVSDPNARGYLTPVVATQWASTGDNTAYPDGQFVFSNNSDDFSLLFSHSWNPLANDLRFAIHFRSYADSGYTDNQRRVGAAIDNLSALRSSDWNTILDSLDVMSDVSLAGALNRFTGEIYSSYSRLINANHQAFAGNMETYLSQVRFGLPSLDLAEFLLNVSYAGLALAYNGNGLPIAYPKNQNGGDRRWNVFALGQGLFGSVDNAESRVGFDYRISGATIGFDYCLTNGFRAGLVGSFGFTDADYDHGSGESHVRSVGVGPYWAYQTKHWFLDGYAMYSFDHFEMERKIRLGTIYRKAESDTDGGHIAAALGGGYIAKISDWMISPSARLVYTHLDVDGFQEQDAGALNLAVHDVTTDSLRTQVALQVARKFKMRFGAFVPEFRARWQHECLDNSPVITSTFMDGGVGSFRARSAGVNRDSALLGAGLTARVGKRLEIYGKYDGEINSDTITHSVMAGSQIKF